VRLLCLILVAELRELTEYLARTCFPEIAVPQATADLVDVAATAAPARRPDPARILTAGHENKTARMISFYCGDTINAPALTAMLQQIIANNRAEGWRKLKRRSGR
jgi:hypothetical protein